MHISPRRGPLGGPGETGAGEVLTQPILAQLQAAEARAARLEQCPAERSIVSRQEARIRDLESQLDFQAVQMKRFEVPPLHRSRRDAEPQGDAARWQKAGAAMPAPRLWGRSTREGVGGEQAGSSASLHVLVDGPWSSCHCCYLHVLHCGVY